MRKMGKPQYLSYDVFAAARDGMAITLYAMLCHKKPEEIKKLLDNYTDEDGQVTTPFIIAARNGHHTVVKMLLTYFKIDIEQTGTVKFDGFEIEGATALWCAAGGGHLKAVQELLNFKADVNHATISRSTPLRAACFDGRLDIVALLIENSADLSIPNKYNNTCLMIAAYKGHSDVVRFLLDKKSDPNSVAHCGATALHFCAERNHLSIAKDLVLAGALMIKNDQGMTPLYMAADSGSADVVEFFVSQPWCTREERIEALELLGASFANDRVIYDIDKCYHYLWLAMHERYSTEPPLYKKINPPVKAYENQIESRDIKDLERLKNNHNALHIEALIIEERILGEDNIELPHYIIFRGAVYADTSRFDRCTALWKRALQLRQKNNRYVNKDLLRFAQVFSQMFHVGVAVEFALAEEIFQYCLDELGRDKERINYTLSSEYTESARESYEMNMHTALYILSILINIQRNKDEELRLGRLVYHFNRLNVILPSKSGYSPLHMVCDEDTQVDEFHVNDVVHFPNDGLVRLLLDCGANPNKTDAMGNSPLHIIVKYSRPISDFLTMHNIITMLLHAECHLDRANKLGQTAADTATTGVASIILRTERKITLRCLAAQVVRKYSIQYKGHVPHTLNDFIEMH